MCSNESNETEKKNVGNIILLLKENCINWKNDILAILVIMHVVCIYIYILLLKYILLKFCTHAILYLQNNGRLSIK